MGFSMVCVMLQAVYTRAEKEFRNTVFLIFDAACWHLKAPIRHKRWNNMIFHPVPYKVCKVMAGLTLLPSLIARRRVGRQTQWWPRHKAIYFSLVGPELCCLLPGLPGFSCWFSFAPVFQWCCSTPQESPGVGRNTLYLSSSHLCFIIVFICLPWWSIE